MSGTGVPDRILPDQYWSHMIMGRLVYLQLVLVEKHLFAAHREVEAGLLTGDRGAIQAVGRLDGTRPRDRVLGRLWTCVLGEPLTDAIMLPERFVAREIAGRPGGPGLPVLVYDPSGDTVADGMARALREIETYALDPVVRLGTGLVGLDPLPAEFQPAGRFECLVLPASAWRRSGAELTGIVLAAAARTTALLWAQAETRAYGLAELPATAPALADDFATGVVAELDRRRSLAGGAPPVAARPGRPSGTQEPLLPLLSELVRCWWPVPGRARHIFGSQFDYLSTLESAHAGN